MSGTAYLDYNATAPTLPAVRDAVMAALEVAGNPSSVHGFGRRARRLVEDARAEVAALAGVVPARIVFTSGGTEANASALATGASGRTGRRILVSAIEHDSVLETVPDAERIPVMPDGTVDLAALDRMLARGDGPALVSVMLVNNETGVIQPVAEASRLAHAHGALFHCDAVQGAGRVAMDADSLGIDLMTLSAHKLGGPHGVGALVVREGIPIAPVLRGGGQEQRRRAGTENVAGIAGFGAAARLARSAADEAVRIGRLRDGLERRIAEAAEAAGVAVTIHGRAARRVANTTCVSMPGVSSETQIMALDLAGVAVSAGSACSSGKVKPSHVLTAMGVDAGEASSAIRVSLGWATGPEDVDRFVDAWSTLCRRRARATAGP
ncbi:cysteine desulfurase [Skermanella mucosa]|uniref:cysteine desulfurase family protein n=1 Tax=Skermanella mucosa TaxID=1789672 RepID=UPI00192CA32D|nr:cysteine desulfurase family protein [Skermanella mucosa]UEM19597.1 cysteine desulfurase [Skermanella mucosa]